MSYIIYSHLCIDILFITGVASSVVMTTSWRVLFLTWRPICTFIKPVIIMIHSTAFILQHTIHIIIIIYYVNNIILMFPLAIYGVVPYGTPPPFNLNTVIQHWLDIVDKHHVHVPPIILLTSLVTMEIKGTVPMAAREHIIYIIMYNIHFNLPNIYHNYNGQYIIYY